MEFSKDLLSFLLPEFILNYFAFDKSTIKRLNDLEQDLHLYFTERNLHPENYEGDHLESKGFYNEITIRDFPLRGKYVYLHLKRRKWLNKSSNEIVSRDWNEVAKGTRIGLAP